MSRNFSEGDLVRVSMPDRAAEHAETVGGNPDQAWFYQVGIVISVRPARPHGLQLYPPILTVNYPGVLIQRSSVLFERVEIK